MAWARSVKPGEVARVTFEVKQSDDPVLYDWLMSLPYGKSSPTVREILRKVIAGTNAALGAVPEIVPKAIPTTDKQPPSGLKTHVDVSPLPDINIDSYANAAIANGDEEDKLFKDMKNQFR